MIEPHNITNFERSDVELQAFIIFAMTVAGKRSSEIAPKVNAFCDHAEEIGLTPFQFIRQLSDSDLLEHSLKEYRFGRYNDFFKGFYQLTFLDLRECSLHELMAVHGIGPKSARFFLLHSRPNQCYIVLDTHLLKFLAEDSGKDLPRATPTSLRQYEAIEEWAIKRLNMPDWADFDLNTWASYATV